LKRYCKFKKYSVINLKFDILLGLVTFHIAHKVIYARGFICDKQSQIDCFCIFVFIPVIAEKPVVK